MKKSGFSYLELIISMGLVIMVVILTTPFLTHVEKAALSTSGEFHCYTELVREPSGDESWHLAQYQRVGNTIEEKHFLPPAAPSDAKFYKGQVTKDEDGKEFCVFVRPSNVVNFKVQLFGGGGSGSKPVYLEEQEGKHTILKGMGGSNAISVTQVDSLTNAAAEGDVDTIKIYNCNDNDVLNDFKVVDTEKKYKNCVGIGGGVGISSTDADKIYSNGLRDTLKRNFYLKNYRQSDYSLTRQLFNNPTLLTKISSYFDSLNRGDEVAVQSAFDSVINATWTDGADFLPQRIKDVGENGKDTFFIFDSDENPVFASGGTGGVTTYDHEVIVDTTSEAKIFSEFKDFELHISYIDYFKKPDNYYVVPGSNGSYFDFGFGAHAALGGHCLKVENPDGSYTEDTCRGDMAQLKQKEPHVIMVAGVPKFKPNSYGAGGGGGAYKFNVAEPLPDKGSDGGYGTGGAIIIEWN